MTYPLSSDVVAGQPTAADHYNNLRADALRFGQAAADSNNLPELLSRYEQNLTIQILGTDRVRVPCSTSEPVSLVVDGYFILRSTVNIDLPTAGKPTGGADNWYVFAVRSPGSTAFSLEVNTSPVESSGRRLIGSFYWTGSAIASPSIRTSQADFINRLVNHLQFTGCQGRLSLDATSPVKDTSGSTLTLHPYKGNLISLYTPGWGWNNYPIEQAGVRPSYSPTINANNVYDIFAYWNGTAVALDSVNWTNLTTRAVALTLTEGLYVKATDPTRLYLGTFSISPNGSNIKDIPTDRGLWNFFNRVQHNLEVVEDQTASWTYNVPGTWRSPNGSDKVFRVVVGLAEDPLSAEVFVNSNGSSSLYGLVGIGVDSNSVNSASVMIHGVPSSHASAMAKLCAILAPGLHTIYWLEATNGSGTVTFLGTQFSGFSIPGMTAIIPG